MSKREEIETMVKDFVGKLTKKLKEAAHETVDLTFGDGEEGPTVEVRSARRVAGKAPRALPAARRTNGHGNGGGDDKRIIAVVREFVSSSAPDIAGHLGKTKAQITPSLRRLVASGAIKKIGNGRYTTYSVR